jgi:hypothetical protein
MATTLSGCRKSPLAHRGVDRRSSDRRLAFAEDPTPAPAKYGPSMLVLPVPGTPLSAETIEERTTKTPDGTSQTEFLTTKIFRDAAGRMRTEQNLEDTNRESASIMIIVYREACTMAVLVPVEKWLPGFEAGSGGPVKYYDLRLTANHGTRRKVYQEREPGQADHRDGIEYTGNRTTTTSPGGSKNSGNLKNWG